MTLEEERARKEAREKTRVQMQILNEHVVALCVSECLKDFFRGCGWHGGRDAATARRSQGGRGRGRSAGAGTGEGFGAGAVVAR